MRSHSLPDPLLSLPFKISDEMTRRDDDWRGEHLIRRPEVDEAATDDGTCQNPDCGVKLDSKNQTGFCRRHYNQQRNRVYKRRV